MKRFQKFLSGTLSECQTVSIKISMGILLILIWVQIAGKDYQKNYKMWQLAIKFIFPKCTLIKFERIEPTLRYAFILANTELNTLVGRRKFVVPLSTMVLPKLYCNKENMHSHRRIQRGMGHGGRDPPPEKSQNIGFFSNTGLDPLKNHKAKQ